MPLSKFLDLERNYQSQQLSLCGILAGNLFWCLSLCGILAGNLFLCLASFCAYTCYRLVKLGLGIFCLIAGRSWQVMPESYILLQSAL